MIRYEHIAATTCSGVDYMQTWGEYTEPVIVKPGCAADIFRRKRKTIIIAMKLYKPGPVKTVHSKWSSDPYITGRILFNTGDWIMRQAGRRCVVVEVFFAEGLPFRIRNGEYK